MADKDKTPGVQGGYASMIARQIVESQKWQKLPVGSAGGVRDGGAPGYDGNAAYVLAAGLGAASTGDTATAGAALDILNTMAKQAESGSNAYRAKPFQIMAKEVGAVIAAKNDAAVADKLFQDAIAIESSLDAPSGPTEPIKPSFELYGEFLLDQGRAKDAAAQFQASLLRTPNRRLSVQGLERANTPKSTSAGK